MNDYKLFIDTGAWIALIFSKDQYHHAAVRYYKSIMPAVQRVTSNFIIAETYTWLRYKTGVKQAAQFISIINRATANGSLLIMMEDVKLHLSAQQLLNQYADQTMSYTDALSIAMMKRDNIAQVFGFDHHFSMAGFELVPNSR